MKHFENCFILLNWRTESRNKARPREEKKKNREKREEKRKEKKKRNKKKLSVGNKVELRGNNMEIRIG